MGYEVRITRKQDWWVKERPEIGLVEWMAVTAADRDDGELYKASGKQFPADG
jgi:hypothetical protein